MPGVGLATRNASAHGGFGVRPPTSFSPNFKVNGLGVVRKGDTFPVHSDGGSSHAATANTIQTHFKVNGMFVTRNGDVMNPGCSSVIANGSPNFNVG